MEHTPCTPTKAHSSDLSDAFFLQILQDFGQIFFYHWPSTFSNNFFLNDSNATSSRLDFSPMEHQIARHGKNQVIRHSILSARKCHKSDAFFLTANLNRHGKLESLSFLLQPDRRAHRQSSFLLLDHYIPLLKLAHFPKGNKVKRNIYISVWP